jgi:hypothetical protein
VQGAACECSAVGEGGEREGDAVVGVIGAHSPSLALTPSPALQGVKARWDIDTSSLRMYTLTAPPFGAELWEKLEEVRERKSLPANRKMAPPRLEAVVLVNVREERLLWRFSSSNMMAPRG